MQSSNNQFPPWDPSWYESQFSQGQQPQPSQPLPQGNLYPPQPQPQSQWQQHYGQPPFPNTQWGQPSQQQQQPYPDQQFSPFWQQPYGQPPLGRQSPQRSFLKKKGILIFIVVLIIAAIVGNFIAYNAARSDSSATIDASSSQQQVTSVPIDTPTAAPVSTPQVVKSGQTIYVSYIGLNVSVFVSCKLLSAKIVPDDGFGQLKAGNEWIVVTVELMNLDGSYGYSYGEADFHIVTGTGNVVDSDLVPPTTYTADNQLAIAATLNSHVYIDGDLVFQIPKGDHQAKLSWNPFFYGSYTANTWNLGL